MTPLLQIPVNVSAFKFESLQNYEICKKPSYCYFLSRAKIASLHENRFKLRAYGERWSLLGGSRCEDVVLVREEGWKRKRKKRVVVVRFNQGFGFNSGGGGGGGGGGRDDGATARILGNLALAIGLTYLSFTGQLGWVLDAIVSVWVSLSLSLSLSLSICIYIYIYIYIYIA
jgi:hypothetical protein